MAGQTITQTNKHTLSQLCYRYMLRKEYNKQCFVVENIVVEYYQSIKEDQI